MDWIITVFLILQIIFHDINIATLVGADLEKVQFVCCHCLILPFPFSLNMQYPTISHVLFAGQITHQDRKLYCQNTLFYSDNSPCLCGLHRQ